MIEIGITSPDAKYHYVNVMGIATHEDAEIIKKFLEATFG